MEPYNLTNNILREYSIRNFYNFFKLFWSQVETAEFNDNYHIKLLCDALQKRYGYWEDFQNITFTDNMFYDILINCPPGSSKSLIVSVFFPVWVWLKYPSCKIITASYSHKIAEELSGKSLRLLQSELYQSICTFKLDSVAVTNIKNSKGGQRFVTSTNGTVTGIHGDIIICDDINSPQSIYSEVDREQTRKFVQEILPSRKTNPKRSYTIYVQQRLHDDDGTGIVLKSKRLIRHINIPAINENGESFFPSRFSLEFLNSMKEQLGTLSFMAQYMQLTQIEGGGIIKREWLKEFPTIEKPLVYFLDSAYGGVKADDNALVGCYKESNNMVIQMCERNKFEFPELLKWLKTNLPSNAKIYIEGKASGKSIIQTLRQQTSFNIIETQPKGSKLERKNAMSPYFEGGRIVINTYINNKQTLIEQLLFDNSKHDDIQDVICMAVDNLLKVRKGNYNIL